MIKSAKYLISSPSVEQAPKPDRPEFAFIGRSNVGKSSLINMLCDNQRLAKTSQAPGKTQMINHFDIVSAKNSRWYLVDLPGYGFAVVSQKKRKNWEKMIADYIRKRENLASVFVLIDSRHTPQLLDLQFINKLGEWKIPFSLVFTKSDKNKPGATWRNVEAFLNEMRKSWSELPPYFITSATTKEGKEELLDYIDSVS